MNGQQNTPKDETITDLSFEQAMERLNDIVVRLERADIGLEEAIALYRQGDALRAHCTKALERARSQIEELTPTQGISPPAPPAPPALPASTEPFEQEN